MRIQMNDCLARIAHLESTHAKFGHAQTGLLRHP